MRKLDQAVWVGWRHRAEEEKRAARKTDADLAAEVSELVGHEVGRALVNHWFRGRREPSLQEFMALCAALGADPGQILLNVRMAYQKLPEAPTVAQALHDRAPSPEYLSKSAKRLKRSKTAPKATPKAKVRA
jgi:transcriptional regulator with XRE-family HTH domain